MRSLRFLRLASLGALLVGVLSVAGTTAPINAADASKSFVPVTPTRLMDTREGLGGGRLRAAETRVLQIAGRDPVPPSGAIAVAINVTVTDPATDGFLTVWPSGNERPVASNLNYAADETVANLVIVGLGSDGAVRIFAQRSTDVVVDVIGWFYAGINPVTPTRLMDTRQRLGGLVLGPHERRDLIVQGVGGLPAGPVGAVALNVTVTEPSEAGFLTVWPSGVDQPLASNLNFAAGETRPNAVVVGVGSGGKISIYNSSGNTHVIVDVAGWFALGFDAVTPVRIMDTRESLGGVTLAPGEVRNLKVLGHGDIPGTDAVGAVSLNVTVTDPTSSGYLTVWPAGRDRPLASNVNFTAGQTVANAVPVGVGDGGQISIFNSSGDTDVVVDVTGWYARSDTTPPRLESLTIEPATIDTSSGPQTVTVTAHLTDDLSGVGFGFGVQAFAEMQFVGPGNQQVAAYFHEGSLVSGTSQDGVYRATMTVPALSAKGTWVMRETTFVDQVRNRLVVTPNALSARGMATSFEQIGEGDGAPPTIQSLSLDRTSVDTSAAAQLINVTLHLTDDHSGVSAAHVQFYNTRGQVVVAQITPASLQSGTAQDGMFVGTITVPRYSASGTWYIDTVRAQDNAGNIGWQTGSELAARGFPWSFEQVAPGDTTAPVLQDLSFTPAAINTSGGAQQVTVTARVTDDLAGAGDSWGMMVVSFVSPSGQYLAGYLGPRISGTALDGSYSLVLTIPALSDSGVWTASMLLLDEVHNQRGYLSADLAARGLPTTFTNN